MVQETASSLKEEKRRSIKGLLTWLLLIPLILGTLMCCGQLALFLIPGDQGGKTSSLLAADYRPWPYEKIPPVNVDAFMTDIQLEETVISGVYWIFPTSTAQPIAQVTPAPTNTPISLKDATATQTKAATNKPTVPTSTVRPSSTPLSTITNTVAPSPTRTYPPLPTTQPPQPTNTSRPPQPTRTFTSIPTSTSTTEVPPTETFTATPETPTPVTITVSPPVDTPTPTPTYAPVRPIAENDGTADQVENAGCRAYFGYRNDNPYEVDIAVGDNNNLNDPAAVANPPQPIHFLVGREFGVFEFTWYTPNPLVWTLDGRTATAAWCR